MKQLFLTTLFLLSLFTTFSQQDCSGADFVCNENGYSFTTSTAGSGFNDLCTGCLSNPDTNPGLAGNDGCLMNGEINPTWIIINVAQSGMLEFTLGAPGGNGFYDWAMWNYNSSLSNPCAPINNNQSAPVACNWNESASGYTGMYGNGNVPPGGESANFEYAIPVTAGQQFVLVFSNWSGVVGATVPVTFGNSIPGNNNPNTAVVTCDPSTPDQTICLGTSANVTIVTNGMNNPSVQWLVTTGVANTTSLTTTVTPTVTTEYVVRITEGTVVKLDTFLITVVNPPAPNAGPDQVICQGQTAVLQASNTQQGNTLLWTQTNNANGNVTFTPNTASVSPTVAFTQPGTYTFTLTETNAVCPPATDQVVVLVSNTTHTTTFVPPSCPGATNGSITITNPNAVEFSIDGGVTWSPNNVFSGVAHGTYTVQSRNQYGCSYSSTINITGSSPLVITTNNDTTVCQNGTVSLLATLNVNSGNFTYNWSHNDITSNVNSIEPTENTVVTVYAQDADGCTSNTVSINVNVLPPLEGQISVSPQVCPGYPGEVNVTGITGGSGEGYTVEYVWIGGQMNYPTQAQIVNPSFDTEYVAIIRDNCESTPFIVRDVIRVGVFPQMGISIPVPLQCEPAVFEIMNTTANDNLANWGMVSSCGAFVEGENVLTTSELLEGVYSVFLWIQTTDGCIDSMRFENVFESQSRPTANFSWSPNPVTNFNTTAILSDLSTLASTYEWFAPNATPSYSSLQNPKLTFPDGEVGSYPVTLIVTSELGCVDTLTQIINVIQEPIVYSPNSFTPDGDEFNQIWKVYINGLDVHNVTLLVFNRWGEIIFENHDLDYGWDGTYNGKVVPSGTYTWKLQAKDVVSDKKYEWFGNVNVLR